MDSKRAANEIIENVFNRDRSDMIIEPLLVTLVLASYLIFTISYGITRLGGLESLSDYSELTAQIATFITLGMLIMVSVFFLLMGRNEKHCQREKELRSRLIGYMEVRRDRGAPIGGHINEMRALDAKIAAEEKPLKAALWGAIIVLPLLVIAIATFTESVPQVAPAIVIALLVSFIALVHSIRNVTTFSYRHEKAWMEFLVPFHKALDEMGVEFANDFRKQVGYRSFLLFFILSLATGWLFMVVWSHLLLRDMNRHFQEQWAWENCLVQALRGFEGGEIVSCDAQDYELCIRDGDVGTEN